MKKIWVFVLFVFVGLSLSETHIPGGNISGVWTADGSPYYIDGEVHIPTNSMLVIEPGCSIIFTGHYKFCVDSNAVLRAIGTEVERIVLTAQDTVLSHIHRWGHRGIRFYHAAEGCTLMYCTVEYGNAYGPYDEDVRGGGIYCYDSSPAIIHTIIRNSTAALGGGICCEAFSNPTIKDNVISDNIARRGGGVCCWNGSCPVISGNEFIGNSGGEIFCGASNPIITGNFMKYKGYVSRLGVVCYYSRPLITSNVMIVSGIYCDTSDPIIMSNLIITCSESEGFEAVNGIECDEYSHPTILNNLIKGECESGFVLLGQGRGIVCHNHSRALIVNNVITENRTGPCGGGIYCYDNSNVIVVNSTITRNFSRDFGGGICCENNSSAVIFNTILWRNTAEVGDEIYVRYYEDPNGVLHPCHLFVTYTDVDSSKCYVEGDSAGEIVWGVGNIYADPLFEDIFCRLSEISPCIDAGAWSVYVPIWDTIIYAPDSDFEAGVRPYRIGWDIGADEYGSSEIAESNIKKPEELEVSLYPNPFNSSCIITAPACASVEIYNLQGRLVYAFPGISGKGPEKYIWHPDRSIPAGVYLVRAITEDGQVAERKVLLLK